MDLQAFYLLLQGTLQHIMNRGELRGQAQIKNKIMDSDRPQNYSICLQCSLNNKVSNIYSLNSINSVFMRPELHSY